jgi:ATP synthase F subunit
MAQEKQGSLVAVIADEDTITGFLLAGVGDVDMRKRSNFLAVDKHTNVRTIEQTFKDFTLREDIAIILISQPIASMIRSAVANHTKVGGGRVARRPAPALSAWRAMRAAGPACAPSALPPGPPASTPGRCISWATAGRTPHLPGRPPESSPALPAPPPPLLPAVTTSSPRDPQQRQSIRPKPGQHADARQAPTGHGVRAQQAAARGSSAPSRGAAAAPTVMCPRAGQRRRPM